MAVSQWLFSPSALHATPTVASGYATVDRELYDRARGVEFLYRLGSSLALPSSAIFTAATWFHRFYMRYSMEDYHRQDTAAACIFLATKTEECGRKLRDVAKVSYAKVNNIQDVQGIPSDHSEVEQTQAMILLTEEALLEALCFDFVVESPHAALVDLFDTCSDAGSQEFAWSIAHDSYRTPLCILYPPKIIAASCFVLAQHISDGAHSASLDARIAATPPSASLPTPPTHKPSSPDASRLAVEHFHLSEPDLRDVADTLIILLEFYHAQDMEKCAHLGPILSVTPPTGYSARAKLYPMPFSQIPLTVAEPNGVSPTKEDSTRTPRSTHGGNTPAPKPVSKGRDAIGDTSASAAGDHALPGRLDLS